MRAKLTDTLQLPVCDSVSLLYCCSIRYALFLAFLTDTHISVFSVAGIYLEYITHRHNLAVSLHWTKDVPSFTGEVLAAFVVTLSQSVSLVYCHSVYSIVPYNSTQGSFRDGFN